MVQVICDRCGNELHLDKGDKVFDVIERSNGVDIMALTHIQNCDQCYCVNCVTIIAHRCIEHFIKSE